MILGYRSGFYDDQALAADFYVVTAAGARALRLSDYGLAPGATADFVLLRAAHAPEAVVVTLQPRRVFKAGRLIAENEALVVRRSPRDRLCKPVRTERPMREFDG